MNLFHNLQNLQINEAPNVTSSGYHLISEDYTDTEGTSEGKDRPEYDLDELLHFNNNRANQRKRKNLSLCRHKLQGRTGCRSRSWRRPPKQPGQDWPTEPKIEIDLLDKDADTEWNQLREMEEFLRMQRLELLRQRAPDSDDEDDPLWTDKGEDCPDKEEDDSLEDADLAFITTALELFSKPDAKAIRTTGPWYKTFTTEGAPTQAEAKQATPTKFNQNLTIKTSVAEKFSCLPTWNEEGPNELTDTEEETEFENQSQGICSITKGKANPFATWQPFNPQGPVYQNSPAQPWWSDSSPQEYSSLEPTLTNISSVSCLTSKITIRQRPLKTSPKQHNQRTKQIHPHTRKLYKPATKRYSTTGTSIGQN
jgi:hypothetical protein